MTRGRERSHITPRKVASQRHMLKPFPQCARAARACSRHTCAWEGSTFVSAQRQQLMPFCECTRATCTCSRHTSKVVCIWHYTLEREALVVCKVYVSENLQSLPMHTRSCTHDLFPQSHLIWEKTASRRPTYVLLRESRASRCEGRASMG